MLLLLSAHFRTSYSFKDFGRWNERDTKDIYTHKRDCIEFITTQGM